MRAKTLLPLIVIMLGSSRIYPHIVPKDSHDRTISVRLQDGATPDRAKAVIVYRLELHEAMTLQDMKKYAEDVDPGLFANNARQFYAQYARVFASIIAANLKVDVGKWDGLPSPSVRKSDPPLLPLKLIERRHTLTEDEGEGKGQALGHLRCTLVFEADFPLQPGKNYLRVREDNFRFQEGQVFFSFENRTKLHISQTVPPGPEINKLPVTDGTLMVAFGDAENETASVPSPHGPPAPIRHEEPGADDDFLRTFRQLRESQAGMLLMLLVFAALGAAHALTPGHGKTLVAAYLVGEHGTMWHALTLGLVTTITHTGVVLAIALMLFFLPDSMSGQARQAIQTGLGLVLGISIICLGFWLLLKRLSGGADHLHLSSGESINQKNGRLGWWGIIVLGVNGGLIPCWDAVAILVAVIGSSEFWLALPALLAFSAGLAGVLVLIGILVVQFRNFAGSRWGEGRLVRSLPIISAVVVTGMGVYLSYASIRHP